MLPVELHEFEAVGFVATAPLLPGQTAVFDVVVVVVGFVATGVEAPGHVVG